MRLCEGIFTPLAERHINSLHEYIAEHASDEGADAYVGRIVDFCNGLSTFAIGLFSKTYSEHATDAASQPRICAGLRSISSSNKA